MANFVYITLDTQAPSNPVLIIAGAQVFTSNQLVTLGISIDDAVKTGYQMKIWGNVDATYDANIKATEELSQWVAYNSAPQIKLSTGDGQKTMSMQVRDAVNNVSSIATANINLDTTLPTVTTTAPDVDVISKNQGKDAMSFTYSSNEPFSEFKVKLVGGEGTGENLGTLIPTTAGSVNTSGIAGNYIAGQVLTITIKGADLETAGATTGELSILKVFVKDMSGKWSV